MFEICSSKQIYHANAIEKIYDYRVDGSFPYVVRMTSQNGIRGYIVEPIENTNDANTLSFAQDTFTVFYQKERYFTGNKVKVLKPKFQNTSELVMMYFTASFQQVLQTFSWGIGSTVDSISNFMVKLPTKSGQIDFAFMESFVAELEARRVAELNAYLKATGLKDTTLTPAEKSALASFDKIQWAEHKLVDVFCIKNSGNILSSEIVENSGDIPYLCASAENNAVSSYIKYKDELKSEGNCIFIGGKTFVVSYQEKDFFSNDSHNLALYLKDKTKRTRLIYLGLASCINKSLSYQYSWGNSISNKKAQKDIITLPSKNNSPNYPYIETIISAIQKLVIKDVVAFADQKISATKSLIKK